MARKCKNKTCNVLITEGHSQFCPDCKALCASCRKKPRGAHSSYCNMCASAYQRLWSARPSGGMNEQRRLKNRLRSRLNRATRDGRLERGSCAVCGATEDIQLRFLNLNDPPDYIWLCKPHHQEVRNEEGRKKRQAQLEAQAKSVGPLAENVFVLRNPRQTPEATGTPAPEGNKAASK